MDSKATLIAEAFATVLNGMTDIEQDAVKELVFHRVKCGAALSDYPALVSMKLGEDEFEFGILGLINGVIGNIHRLEGGAEPDTPFLQVTMDEDEDEIDIFDVVAQKDIQEYIFNSTGEDE